MGSEGNVTLLAMCPHWTWVGWCIVSPMKPYPDKSMQAWKDGMGKYSKEKM